LSAVTKVNPSSIADAAIIASGTCTFISLLISMAFLITLFVSGIIIQYSIAVCLIEISLSEISFKPSISISVTTEI
jgi:hypothetical protein